MRVTLLTRTDGQRWTPVEGVELSTGLGMNLEFVEHSGNALVRGVVSAEQVAAAVGHSNFTLRVVDDNDPGLPPALRRT